MKIRWQFISQPRNTMLVYQENKKMCMCHIKMMLLIRVSIENRPVNVSEPRMSTMSKNENVNHADVK